LASKKKRKKCSICNQRKGKRECPREDIVKICSQCCGSIRNLNECIKTCPHIVPLLEEEGLLQEIRRAFRTKTSGTVVVWFERRNSYGKWDSFYAYLELERAGLIECAGDYNLSDKEYRSYFAELRRNLETSEISWEEARYLLKLGINIREALGLPIPESFSYFKKIVDPIEDVHIEGSSYKCFKCAKGDLSKEDVDFIIETVKEEIEAGILYQEEEPLYYFLCDECANNDPGTNVKKTTNLSDLVYDTITNQLVDDDPPEVRHTYRRLSGQGYSEDEIFSLIGGVLLAEISYVMEEKKPFNRTRYIKALEELR